MKQGAEALLGVLPPDYGPGVNYKGPSKQKIQELVNEASMRILLPIAENLRTSETSRSSHPGPMVL